MTERERESERQRDRERERERQREREREGENERMGETVGQRDKEIYRYCFRKRVDAKQWEPGVRSQPVSPCCALRFGP